MRPLPAPPAPRTATTASAACVLDARQRSALRELSRLVWSLPRSFNDVVEFPASYVHPTIRVLRRDDASFPVTSCPNPVGAISQYRPYRIGAAEALRASC